MRKFEYKLKKKKNKSMLRGTNYYISTKIYSVKLPSEVAKYFSDFPDEKYQQNF